MESKKYECKTIYKTTQKNATCCLPLQILTNNGNVSKLVETSSKCFLKLLLILKCKLQSCTNHQQSIWDRQLNASKFVEASSK